MSDGHVLAIISNLLASTQLPVLTDFSLSYRLGQRGSPWQFLLSGVVDVRESSVEKGYFRIGISKEVMSGGNQNMDWELTTWKCSRPRRLTVQRPWGGTGLPLLCLVGCLLHWHPEECDPSDVHALFSTRVCVFLSDILPCAQLLSIVPAYPP